MSGSPLLCSILLRTWLALGKHWLMQRLGSSEGHGKPVITEIAVFYMVANSQAAETSRLCERGAGWVQAKGPQEKTCSL